MNDDSYKQVESLTALFREHGLVELHVDDGSFKLTLRRDLAAGKAARQPRRPQPTAPHPAPARRTQDGRTVAVRSPLIGVFYRSASPDAPAFVELGDAVKEGEAVCIVEAMKVFNEIRAEWSGRVVAIPAENGQLVQAGDPLVVLEFGEAGQTEGR